MQQVFPFGSGSSRAKGRISSRPSRLTPAPVPGSSTEPTLEPRFRQELELADLAVWRAGCRPDRAQDKSGHLCYRDSPCISIRYSDRLPKDGIHPPLGSLGDRVYNALAEMTKTLDEAKSIRRRPPTRIKESLKLATQSSTSS